MALPLAFDLDLLRSFVIVAEEKNFTRAAERVGRTQSAMSLQMQRLEGFLGQSVLERAKGGTVELTAFGTAFLPKARDMLMLNDSILQSVHAAPVAGTVKLGLPEELTPHHLPRILENIARVAPSVEVQVTTAASCVLSPQLTSGGLDLALLTENQEPRHLPAEVVWTSRLRWVTSDIHNQHLHHPLPITVSPEYCPWRPAWLKECLWRAAPLRALERSNRKYHIVATSGTTSGQLAAAAAGLAVTAALEIEQMRDGLRLVRPGEGLPELPDVKFLLCRASAPRQPITDILAEQIRLEFNRLNP